MIRRRSLAVVALGGNALVPHGESVGSAARAADLDRAARSLAAPSCTLRLAVIHGSGPPEGPLSHRLDRRLASLVPASRVVTLPTQVVVDRADPAFAQPARPIGPPYERRNAERLRADRGWVFRPDGTGYRRVLPSPSPREVVELETVRLLVEAGLMVVCSGGGGIPVIASADELNAVEAVVDKDATAALLATGLGADLLVLLTDVAGVYHDWGTDEAKLITRTSPAELADRTFATESMAPKVAAACRFVEDTGRAAIIASLDDAADAVAGHAGTWVLPNEPMGRRAA